MSSWKNVPHTVPHGAPDLLASATCSTLHGQRPSHDSQEVYATVAITVAAVSLVLIV